MPNVEELVPPLAIGKIPVTSVAPPPKLIPPLYNAPPVERTLPVPREDIVVEPVTTKGPLTVKAEVLALVTVKTLVAELNVKLEDVAKVFVPAPNNISLAVIVCSWIVGVVPPEERTEPLPETEVT